jgi:hypothetical protein
MVGILAHLNLKRNSNGALLIRAALDEGATAFFLRLNDAMIPMGANTRWRVHRDGCVFAQMTTDFGLKNHKRGWWRGGEQTRENVFSRFFLAALRCRQKTDKHWRRTPRGGGGEAQTQPAQGGSSATKVGGVEVGIRRSETLLLSETAERRVRHFFLLHLWYGGRRKHKEGEERMV